ncbi:MAG: HAMP domain-containing protein [Deltaproteobacteria bacterium]|nr:HAMP domain-containing protein [Deltaproteobacteria bacterium]
MRSEPSTGGDGGGPPVQVPPGNDAGGASGAGRGRVGGASVSGPFRFGLHLKLTLLIALAVALTGLALTWLNYRASRASLKDQLAKRGAQLARDLALSARLGLLSGDRQALEELAHSAIEEPDLLYVAFVGEDGVARGRAGRVPARLATTRNLSAGGRPRLRLRPAGRGQRAYDIVAPVSVERTSAQGTEDALFQLDSAPGAAPSVSREVVGLVQIGLSFEETDRRIHEELVEGIVAALFAVLVGLLAATVLAGMLTRGLRAVIVVSQRMAEGQLAERVPSRPRGDELNDLAIHFNRMADALAQRDEIFRANEELRAQNVAIQRSSAMKSAFLATMSHELRTPMHAILGFTRIVLRKSGDGLPEKQRANLEKVVISAESLLELINDILDLSKIEAGQMTLAAEDVDLGGVVHSVAEALQPLAQAKSLLLRAAVAPDLPITVADSTRLRQILTNLVGNAVKFTSTGEVVVAARFEGPRDRFVLEVRDTGVGIPEDQRQRVFDRFHQVDASATRSFGGTGLGLAIVRDLVELLGGTIHIESTVGAGSTFTVHLPRRSPAAVPAPAPAPIETRMETPDVRS